MNELVVNVKIFQLVTVTALATIDGNIVTNTAYVCLQKHKNKNTQIPSNNPEINKDLQPKKKEMKLLCFVLVFLNYNPHK